MAQDFFYKVTNCNGTCSVMLTLYEGLSPVTHLRQVAVRPETFVRRDQMRTNSYIPAYLVVAGN